MMLVGMMITGRAMAQTQEQSVWQWVQAELDAGKTSITLPGDAVAGPNDGSLMTKSGVEWVTINLNGYSIDRGLSGSAAVTNGNVITANSNLSIINTGSGGGIITGGNNTGDGGGIVMNINSGESLILNNVTVKKNHARFGGGIYLSDTQIDALDSVQIRGNAATRSGGVYYAGSEFSVSGGIVSGNTDDNGEDNVYLASGRMLSIPQKPAEGTSIGITMEDGSGIFAAGSGHTISKAEKAYFFSDDPQYGVGLNPASQLFLGRFRTVLFDANTTDEVTGTMEPQTFIEGEEQEITPHTFKRRNYGFDGWNTKSDGTGTRSTRSPLKPMTEREL